MSHGLTVDGSLGTLTEAALIATTLSAPPSSTAMVPSPWPAPTPQRQILVPPLPVPPTPSIKAMDGSPAFVAKMVAPLVFRNDADINNAFMQFAGADFVDWFNNNVSGRGAWVDKNGNAMYIGSRRNSGPVKARFNQIWDRIPDMFGTRTINLFQFLALMSIMMNGNGERVAADHGTSLAVGAILALHMPLIAFRHGSGRITGAKCHSTEPVQ